jgi:hypothetical protein
MGDSTKYWASTMFRGSAAILAGTGVLFLPHMVSSELRDPLAPSLAVLCLAAFGVIDGVVLMRASRSAPDTHTRPSVLWAHGLSGAVIGIVLLAMLLGQMELRWFLALASLQALMEAGSAMVLAAGSAPARRARSCRVSAGISAVCAIALVVGSVTLHTGGGLLIDGYLCVFGVNLMVLSASMLSGERSSSRLSPTINLHSVVSR